MTKSENKYKHLTRKQKYFADSVNKGHDERNNNEENYIKQREDLVEGRNAVIELLKSNKTIEQLFIANGKMEGSINKILGLAKDKGVIVKEVDRKKLDLMSETKAHQGVIAQITPFKYSTVDEILNYAKQKDEDPFIVILDELEDPHNLGSIIRTAETAGVHGVIIPKRRAVRSKCNCFKIISRCGRTCKNCKSK